MSVGFSDGVHGLPLKLVGVTTHLTAFANERILRQTHVARGCTGERLSYRLQMEAITYLQYLGSTKRDEVWEAAMVGEKNEGVKGRLEAV
jgi:hypothetical protein